MSTHSTGCADALTFYQADRLRHIVSLKYLHLYGQHARCFVIDDGAVLILPTHVSSWDVSAYPAAHTLILPTALTATAAAQLVDCIRPLCPQSAVFKFCDPLAQAAFVAAFNLQPTRTFYTYSLSTVDHLPPAEAVRTATELDEATLKLYLANGYGREEVAAWFAAGARAFTIEEAGQPVSSCFVFQNYDNIWEVAAVHTLDSARRKGYARQVVTAALRTLLTSGRVPRYQVEADNTASIRLAESLGMTRYLEFRHFVPAALPG